MLEPRSEILRLYIRVSFYIVNMYAVYLLFRGHDLPGGGFIAGIATGISFIMFHFIADVREINRMLYVDPVKVAATGMMLAIGTGFIPLFFGQSYLQHTMWHFDVAHLGEIHVGTTLLFDIGVYLVVVGICVKIIFVLARSTQGYQALDDFEQEIYSAIHEQPIETGLISGYANKPVFLSNKDEKTGLTKRKTEAGDAN